MTARRGFIRAAGLHRKRHVRLLFMLFRQEQRMRVALLRAGEFPADITYLIKRFRKYA